MHMNHLLTLALSFATAEAAYKGFNYGSTKGDGSARTQSDFEAQFKTAKSLVGTSGFNSARLYTMIQGNTATTPIEAIPAAIEQKTSLLLGLWASGGGIDNEVAALKNAINQYGEDFTKLVVGISVGSEDLYRNSVTGVKSNAGVGLDPGVLVDCIEKVKTTISGTSLSDASIGHVDTWDAWTNTSNSDVINHIDWLGFDTYPYYQTTDGNSIDNAKSLFDEAVAKTNAVAKGKEIWITETGWPTSASSSEGEAVASVANAKQYWDQVGCPLFGVTNTWWYILEDEGAAPSFGVTGADLSTTPLYNLSCGNSTSSTTASFSKATGKTGKVTGSKASSAYASSTGFASKSMHASSSFSRVAAATSTPLTGASKTASAGTTGSTGSSSSGSSSGSGSSGSSTSGDSTGSDSSSSSSSSASPSSTQFSAAGRNSASVFGAVFAALALAIAV